MNVDFILEILGNIHFITRNVCQPKFILTSLTESIK